LGSVILAGLLLKLGTYGFVRFTLALFSYANNIYSPFIYVLGLLSVIFGSLLTIRQIDLKKIIAYSSVAHMNLSVLGIFSNNLIGFDGAFYLMIAHGIVSPGLFFIIGMFYEKMHTRLLFYFGGLNILLPL
jgi:NADH:ubiquinone oxidoreductase subunit 4 (subunit M)